VPQALLSFYLYFILSRRRRFYLYFIYLYFIFRAAGAFICILFICILFFAPQALLSVFYFIARPARNFQLFCIFAVEKNMCL